MTRTKAQTRAELIDSQLAQSGWNVKDPTQVIEEFDILVALPDGISERRTPYEGHQQAFLEGCQRAGLFDAVAMEGAAP